MKPNIEAEISLLTWRMEAMADQLAPVSSMASSSLREAVKVLKMWKEENAVPETKNIQV